MAIVALRQNAWDSASGPQKAVARMLIDQLQLGTPASGSIGGTGWYVWSDGRITPGFVENMAWVFSHLSDFTDAPVRDYATHETIVVEYPERVREQREALDENGDSFDPPQYYYVWVETGETLTREEEVPLGDVFTLAADANLDVAWFTARESLPAAWVPDGEV